MYQYLPMVRRLAAAGRVVAILPLLSLTTGESRAVESEKVRVVGVVADVVLAPDRSSFRTRATLDVEGEGVHQIVFRTGEAFSVESVTTREGIVEYRRRGGEVIVHVDPALEGRRAIVFTLSGTPRAEGAPKIRPEGAILGPRDGWIPWHPQTWATADITVHAPEGWVVVGPGRRAASSGEGTWRWVSEVPIRSLAVAGAPGLVLTETRRGPMMLRVASHPGAPDADALLVKVLPAIFWHSATFVPYPFDGLNVVFLDGLPRRVRGSGIVAAPSDLSLSTSADGAELISGQWFGERLAGDGGWIEAWAAWEPVAFARAKALPLPSETRRQRDEYFRLLSGDVALAKAGPDGPEAVLRGKGSAAPEMVRLGMGEGPFFEALRGLFQQSPEETLPLESFRSMLVAQAPDRAGKYFDEWFGRPGAPELTATLRTLRTADDQWRTDVALVQERGVYTLPVELVFYGEGGAEKREWVQIEETKTPLVYVLPFRALRIELDPLDRIFRRR